MASANKLERAKSQYSLAGSEIEVGEGECLVRHYTKRLNDVKILCDQDAQTRPYFIDPTEVIDQITLIVEKAEALDESYTTVVGNLNQVLHFNRQFESFQVCLFWFLIALLVVGVATLGFVLWLWFAKAL